MGVYEGGATQTEVAADATRASEIARSDACWSSSPMAPTPNKWLGTGAPRLEEQQTRN